MFKHTSIAMMMWFCIANCPADTFRNRQTGDMFQGFATQKKKQNLTMVYDNDQGKFKSVNLAEFDVTPNGLGRRNNVAVIPILKEEIILSQAVVESVTKEIIDASNKGPMFIILEMDSPGGRADYMKQLCSAIIQTDNCPVVAHIIGGEYSGVYSAAVTVALACDRIYIAADTAMGTISPAIGNISEEYNSEQIDIFNSKNLAAYKSYIAALAENAGRSSVLAMAMLDMTMEVVEVTDKAGKKSLIDRNARNSSQTIVRNWSKPAAAFMKNDTENSSARTTLMELTLTPADAVYTKMADKIVNSRTDIIENMQVSDPKLIRRAASVEKTIRKFVATRRNLNKIIASVDYLQARADELKELLSKSEADASVTRQTLRNQRTDSRFDSSLQDRINIQRGLQRTVPRSRGRRVREQIESEYIIESEAGLNREDLLDELSFVLIDLISDYNRAIVLARRFPGALPLGLTVRNLENKFDTAEALYDDVTYRR